MSNATGNLTGTSDLDHTGAPLRSRGYAYDLVGNLTSATDARGHTTTFSVDAASRLVGQSEPVSDTSTIQTGFGYDEAGNPTRYTNGAGATTYTTYTPWNLPESTVEPTTAATPNASDRTYTTSYDVLGRAVRLAEPGGVTRTADYNELGDLIEQTGSGAAAATAGRTYGYDLAGRLTSATGAGGQDTFGYDDRGLLTSTGGPSGAATFTYDADGRLSGRTDSAGSATYTYDAAGRSETAADPTTGITATYGYDVDGNLSYTGYTGGITRAYGYDDLDRVTSDVLKNPAGTAVASITYGYNKEGQVNSKTTAGYAGAAATTYGYDWAGRITNAVSGGTTLNYDYDAAGNLTRAGSTTYGYDERDRLTSSTSSGSTTTYAYTPRGTLTSAGTTTYTSDAFDQTVTAATPGGSFSYTYDALGRLATRGPATFAYSGLGNIVTADGTATYSHDAAGGLLGINQAGTATLAVTDQHDDLVATANPATGALAGSVAYSPLGVVTATVGTQRSLGYQSGWTDPATGAVNMLSRWYSPGTGAFTSRDTVANSPVGHSVDANRYTYGNGSPLDVTDPTGHGGCKWVWRWDSTSRTYTYQFVCGGETGTRGRPQLGGDDRPGVTYGPDNPGRYCYVLGLGCGGRYVSPWQDGAQHGAARYRSPSSSHRSGPRGSGGGGGGRFASPYRCLSQCGGLTSRPRPARPLPPQDPCAHGRHCTVPKLPPVKPQFSPVKDKTRPDQLAKGTPTVIGGAAITGTTGQPTTCDDTAICAGTGLTPGQLPGDTGLPGTAACAPDNTISYASLSTALTPTCTTTPGNAAPPNGDINININVPAPNLGDTAGDPIPEPAAPPLNINVPAENLGTHINYNSEIDEGTDSTPEAGHQPPPLSIEDAQFGAKVGKHAQDFGLDPKDPAARDAVRSRIIDIYQHPSEIRQGPWNPKGGGGTDHLFFRQGSDVVVTRGSGHFVTILVGGESNGWFRRAEVVGP